VAAAAGVEGESGWTAGGGVVAVTPFHQHDEGGSELASFVGEDVSRPARTLRVRKPLEDVYLWALRGSGRISTYPSVPCTRIRCPSRMSCVACSTPTTAGKPYSRAITAPWVIRPPTSVTRPLIARNRGAQLGSV